MAEQTLRQHNLIATYLDVTTARDAVRHLQDESVDVSKISVLSSEDEKIVFEKESRQEATDAPADVARDVVVGGAAGAAAGGALGLVAGAVAFAIPGVGPAVGTGIWATTLGGATAGATAGGVYGGIKQMWDRRYADAVKAGKVLVGFHTNDADEADAALKVLGDHDPERVDRFDEKGQAVEATE